MYNALKSQVNLGHTFVTANPDPKANKYVINDDDLEMAPYQKPFRVSTGIMAPPPVPTGSVAQGMSSSSLVL
jgi:hypothetical protein